MILCADLLLFVFRVTFPLYLLRPEPLSTPFTQDRIMVVKREPGINFTFPFPLDLRQISVF